MSDQYADPSKRMNQAHAELDAARARRAKAPCPHCSSGALQPAEPHGADKLKALAGLKPYVCDHCKQRSYLKK